MFYRTVSILLFWIIFFFDFTSASSASQFSILAFGDSITQGIKRDSSGYEWGITSPPNGARTDDGYEPDLEAFFVSRTPHVAYVYNWGYSGEQSYEGVNRIDSVLNSRNADFILIMEGANDFYYGVSANTTKANLSIMIDKSRTKKTDPILATITPNTERSDSYRIPQEYNPQIMSLAQDKNVILAGQYSALAPSWDEYTSGDGVHLNDAGERKMAETWLDAILLHLSLKNNIVPILHLLLAD